MVLFLSLLWATAQARVIDAGTAYTFIVSLAGVIALMGGFIAKREISRSREIGKVQAAASSEVLRIREACAAEVVKIKDEAAKEVKEMLVEQIRELRGHKELAETLLDVIDRKRKGG